MYFSLYFIICFWVYAEVSAIFYENEMTSSLSFQLICGRNGSSLCSTDEPDLIVTGVRSQTLCAGKCVEYSNCIMFNYFSDAKRCEIYQYQPTNFNQVQNCSAQKSKVFEFRSCLQPARIPIAFSVGLAAVWSNQSTVIFDTVISNEGGYYNLTSGKFTPPEDGTYYFTMTAYPTSYIRLLLVKNETGIIGLDGLSNSLSNSVLLSLKMGESVWMHMAYGRVAGEQPTAFGKVLYATFTGFQV